MTNIGKAEEKLEFLFIAGMRVIIHNQPFPLSYLPLRIGPNPTPNYVACPARSHYVCTL